MHETIHNMPRGGEAQAYGVMMNLGLIGDDAVYNNYISDPELKKDPNTPQEVIDAFTLDESQQKGGGNNKAGCIKAIKNAGKNFIKSR